MLNNSKLIPIEILGAFGAGKTTLCNALYNSAPTLQFEVYRQSDYLEWRKQLSFYCKLRAILKRSHVLCLISLECLPYLLTYGAYCPLRERIRRVGNILWHHAFLAGFAANHSGVVLLDEWCVNNLATMRLPKGGKLNKRLARCFYGGAGYLFVHLEATTENEVENIERRRATAVRSENIKKNVTTRIFLSGDKTKIRVSVLSSSEFHKGSAETLSKLGKPVVSLESDYSCGGLRKMATVIENKLIEISKENQVSNTHVGKQ